MNILSKWIAERRRIKQQQKDNDAAVDRACKNQRREKLKERVKEFKINSADCGFRYIGWPTGNEDYTWTAIRAVTPKGDIILIEISHNGAIDIQQITHEHRNQ